MTYNEMLRFELGNPNNKPLVFLHGIFVPLETYVPFIRELADHDYYVIAPMLHPRRDDDFKPGTVEEYADKFLEFAQERNLFNYPIVAHSFGSAIAFEAATKSQDIAKIAALAPTQPTSDSFGEFAKKALIGNMKNNTANFKNSLQYPMSSFYNFIQAPKQFMTTAGEMLNYSFPENVEQPVLFSLAEKDDYYPIDEEREKEITDLIQKSFTNPTIEILKGQVHGFPTFHPEKIAEMVANYLNK